LATGVLGSLPHAATLVKKIMQIKEFNGFIVCCPARVLVSENYKGFGLSAIKKIQVNVLFG